MTDDEILANVLFYNISRQLKASAALALLDATNCYDRLAQAVAALVFEAFGVPPNPTTSMLTAIQQMKFFLHTVFGDSAHASRGGLTTLKDTRPHAKEWCFPGRMGSCVDSNPSGA